MRRVPRRVICMSVCVAACASCVALDSPFLQTPCRSAGALTLQSGSPSCNNVSAAPLDPCCRHSRPATLLFPRRISEQPACPYCCSFPALGRSCRRCPTTRPCCGYATSRECSESVPRKTELCSLRRSARMRNRRRLVQSCCSIPLSPRLVAWF